MQRLIIAVGILLIGFGILFSGGGTNKPDDRDTPIDLALLERGKAVYLSNYCGTCHSLDAVETRGTFGPPHDSMYQEAITHLADDSYTGNATTPAEYIMESLVEPQIYYSPGYAASPHAMPAFTHLSQEDLDSLVYMLLQQ